MADKTDYSKFAALRHENLGKLVNALRSDPKLLQEFNDSSQDVAKRFDLSLSRAEAQKISDLVTANPAVGQIDPNLLEAVAGGANYVICGNANKCG